MRISFDSVLALGLAVLTASLSVTAFVRTDARDPVSSFADGTYQRGYEDRFENSVPIQDGATTLWNAVRWVLFRETASGAVAGSDGWLFTAEEFKEPQQYHDFGRVLLQVQSALSSHDVTLIPVIVPDKARMQAYRLPRGRSERFERRYANALDTIAAADLPAIDLRLPLDFAASFMRTDTHWSPEGASRVARAIASNLETIDLAQASVTTVETGSVSFAGDLLRFVNTGVWRNIVGPEAETIDTFETTVESSSGLIGEAVVPIALVGTSYSAKLDFHFAGFLKDALQADLLNLSSIGKGPFAPMDAFLAEIETLSSKPTLVIWEIPERYLTTRSKHQ